MKDSLGEHPTYEAVATVLVVRVAAKRAASTTYSCRYPPEELMIWSDVLSILASLGP